MTQKTVLNDAHRRLGAKMVDFGGWDMPLHYGSQIEEHHAVRRDCGMFDVSHMCAVDVTGKDAKAFLLRLIANNVDKLKESGKALYSADKMLSIKRSEENPLMLSLYDGVLKGRVHELLHVHYNHKEE